jgi:ATP-dependent DNA helicase RecG
MAPRAASRKPAGGAAPRRAPAGSGLAEKLAKLGVTREEDLVLHLPLRYEDHTRLVRIAALAAGATAQTEGVVVRTDIQYRPRRQLVCLLEDPDAAEGARTPLVLRFFTFYPNQQKALQPGHRVRVFGEVRDGHFGLEIVHPQFKVVAPGAPLPDRLTPVYPTTAGLGQETLRGVIARALAADPARTAESLPEDFVRRRREVSLQSALYLQGTHAAQYTRSAWGSRFGSSR